MVSGKRTIPVDSLMHLLLLWEHLPLVIKADSPASAGCLRPPRAVLSAMALSASAATGPGTIFCYVTVIIEHPGGPMAGAKGTPLSLSTVVVTMAKKST